MSRFSKYNLLQASNNVRLIYKAIPDRDLGYSMPKNHVFRVQIHKRFIVNINFINKIQDNTCFLTGQLSDITELKVSKNYKKGLMDSFYDL